MSGALSDISISCFKAYDVRGRVPDQLNESIAYRIGRAYAQVIQPSTVAVGFDIRLTSEALCDQLSNGLRDEGVDVINIGCCGTEEIYFATAHLKVDGGIVVTASHNPKDYNGMKMVREESKPIHADNGLMDIRRVAESALPTPLQARGILTEQCTRSAYIEHLMSYLAVDQLTPLKLVANPGNGGAGLVLKDLLPLLPFEVTLLQETPDGHFPNGVPNPLLEENREVTRNAVIEQKADFGMAWDGDFDRCFFFDETGRFIEGYYLVGLFSEFFLKRNAGEVVVHDPRLYWNTQCIAEQYGTRALKSKTGHAYMKGIMREHDAVYGGEMSAHHYFRDFSYCDSGMIPWLIVAQMISQTGIPLSQMVDQKMQDFPVSGEINFTLNDADAALDAVEAHFLKDVPLSVDKTDGVSLDFADWRFNLRKSNTEPLVRLNVETRGDQALMEEKRDAILELLAQY
ncbi:MAG: phosphomannomutase [Pseudomonadota bacterium]